MYTNPLWPPIKSMKHSGLNSQIGKHQHLLSFGLFFFICLVFYYDTIQLPFVAEDYVRIVRHYSEFENELMGPLNTPPAFTARFRPVQFYALGLAYKLFETKIFLYRMVGLILLALSAFLLARFLTESLGVRRWPAMIAALFSVMHFSLVDIVYFYCAQPIFIIGQILLIILLIRLYRESFMSTPSLINSTILFLFALLTLRSTIVFYPLALFRYLHPSFRRNYSAKRMALGFGILLIPILLILVLESGRGRSAPSLIHTSLFQLAKNGIVLVSHLFHTFRPFGFTQLLESEGISVTRLLAFFGDNPKAVLMIALAIGFVVVFGLVWFRGDFNCRFLCLGLLVNLMMFSQYEAGTSLRYLNLSVVFLSGIAAYLYSQRIPSFRYRIGIIIATILFLYNILTLHYVKQPYLVEIRTLDQLKKRLIQGEQISPGDYRTIQYVHRIKPGQTRAALRAFWKINSNE